MATLFIMYWKHFALVILISGFAYLGYNKIYQIGYTKATMECQARIKEYEDNLKDRIKTIESNSVVILEEYSKGRAAATKEYKDILTAARSKPLVIYQNGNCEISPNFSKAYIDALKRANKK